MTWRWLESTRQLQEESFGMNFKTLEGDALADYLTMNFAAAVAELGEFSQEVGWKSWAQPRGWVHRRQALGELVDTMHFIGNILTALEVTDDEWEQAYRHKQDVNARRQLDGYDGVSTKCPNCRRALDDQPMLEVDGSTFCVSCGIRLGAVDD